MLEKSLGEIYNKIVNIYQNQSLKGEGQEYLLFEERFSDGAALKHHEKSNIGLRDSPNCRIKEPGSSLGAVARSMA